MVTHWLYEDSVPADAWSVQEAPITCLRNMGDAVRLEFWATLALRHTPGLGARTAAKLLKHYGSALRAINDCRNWPVLGLAPKITENYASEKWRESARMEWEHAGEQDAGVLLWRSVQYPPRLRQLPDAPMLLYCRGDVSLLEAPMLAMVGSRFPTSFGQNMATLLASTLSSSGISIVSGMALGIDRQAHAGALKGIGKSIGVLGTGINIVYPKSNMDLFHAMEESGLLVSEFPPALPPAAHNFPVRNRIISGLTLGVVVVEAALRSGSLVTARLALEQNREVFAVSGPAMNSHYLGCQNLIRQGASPVFNAEDILMALSDSLREYNLSAPQSAAPPLAMPPPVPGPKSSSPDSLQGCAARHSCLAPATPDLLQPDIAKTLFSHNSDTRIIEYLRNTGPVHIDALADAVELSSGELNAALLGLEMTGVIRRLAGARYEAI